MDLPDVAGKYGLIGTRSLCMHDPIHERVAKGLHMKITSEVAMNTAVYERLLPWQKRQAFAIAVGMQLDKATLCLRAAAHAWDIACLGKEPLAEVNYILSSYTLTKKKSPPGVKYRSLHVHYDEVVEGVYLRATSLERTIFDIATIYSVREGVLCLIDALHKYPDLDMGIFEKLSHDRRMYRRKGKRNMRTVLEIIKHVPKENQIPMYLRDAIILGTG
ncbi:Uncharacterised protein [Corynebacterium kutscheri]|uniref:AbiEi antitoxin C-terminal domain-containing protein n=1 Tax=Corynebacterium kutscheri TaxID=35755 RepID=A0A0F6R2J3_9CORY|nr:hypothetical protein [Corynebacterium kutscheri]AKE41693.1 hypothetical protein UL82_07660 [Corynebacterium kutscheri]VEH08969.1 Uncharacterised protein [Corynebacterium kutscheri]VEH10020.1 Uncharacterised protein [Corynebacterium kutscheri]VEH80101.1 Uncharacterised protein [Corynebacterium kutscheri]